MQLNNKILLKAEMYLIFFAYFHNQIRKPLNSAVEYPDEINVEILSQKT